MADAATRYWRVRLDFDHAVSFAQTMEIPEAAYHPVVDSKDLRLVEFKEAMRRRIRDVAASRDLSDEEIKPALTLKHQEIARFSTASISNAA
jgi:hypothetical protein